MRLQCLICYFIQWWTVLEISSIVWIIFLFSWWKVLSHMITKAKNEGLFQGLKLSRSSPSASLLCRWLVILLWVYSEFLWCAEKLTGYVQSSFRWSDNKSPIMFSPNIPPRFKSFMRSIIGTPSANTLGKYLGWKIEMDGRSSGTVATKSWKESLLLETSLIISCRARYSNK